MKTLKKPTRGGKREGAGAPQKPIDEKRVILSSMSVAPETPHRLAHVMHVNGLPSVGRAIDWLTRDIRPDE